MVFLTAALASLLIGLLLGLLGGGGSLLTLPLLTEHLGMEAHRAAATSLVVVGVTAVAGLLTHARAGRVRFRTGGHFGLAGLGGAAVGGLLGGFLPARVILLGFTGVMLASAELMFLAPAGRIHRSPEDAGPARPVPVSRLWAAGAATGLFAGAVGAGGGFLVVPALSLVGGLTMVEAIGTSLLVVALNAVGGVAGYAAHVDLDWPLAAALSTAMVGGSLLGARLLGRVSPTLLRGGFALLLLLVAATMTGRLYGWPGAALLLSIAAAIPAARAWRRRIRARVSARAAADTVV